MESAFQNNDDDDDEFLDHELQHTSGILWFVESKVDFTLWNVFLQTLDYEFKLPNIILCLFPDLLFPRHCFKISAQTLFKSKIHLHCASTLMLHIDRYCIPYKQFAHSYFINQVTKWPLRGRGIRIHLLTRSGYSRYGRILSMTMY